MSERRRTKRRRESDSNSEEIKPSKVEYEVAKYLKSKLPPKKTMLLGHKVDYFIASKAIDCLMDSKWATRKRNEKEALFTTRDSVVEFMELMLRHKFFHRALKIIVTKDAKKKKNDNEENSSPEDGKERKKEKEKTSKKEKAKVEKETEKESEIEKKKEKKKVKLDMHMEQVFVDSNEPYVWIYDPIPLKAWIIGAGLVFGAVAICLFPLWPKTVRNYVYYLSIAAAAFLFFIIALAVLRLVIFVVVWLLSFGKHHFWLLPNLTEDVGFFESFWPLYDYHYKGNKTCEETSETASEETTAKKQESDSETELQAKQAVNGANSDNGFEILDSADVNETED
ncbi:translocation protein SEC62-like protein [Leptotrombidium deliense]|uniref:Translocation protein SEC62 n=1 Tax=Leptotrombidium deliense TaxID=299467 RepID=A0A443SDW6_9ACAR|nr:translocation protein SEC62-like protein [Leptotrombidium deliense]